MILHATEAGQGPPLVLLHGLFGMARNFGAAQRALVSRLRVIALDLRNHGASPHAPGMAYATMAADVIETLAALDALPARFVGHSMGGKVAMRAALDRPDAVTRLVVADVAPVAYAHGFEAIAGAMAALDLAPGLTRAGADAALAEAVPDAAMRMFLLQNLLPGAHPSWRIGLAEIVAGLPDIVGWPDHRASYAGPALFIAGEHSHYIRPEHRPTIRALFPTARFVTLKAAGHWLHADNPSGFIALLEAFLPPGA